MPKIKSKGKSQKAKVISNRNIKDNYFEIIIEAPEIVKSAQPGQFVNIKVSDRIEPLLRRPLSIHRIGKWRVANGKWQYGIKILYEVIGKGTEIISKKKEGEYLDVIGPLGNGFQTTNHEPRTIILIAGGMGTAPLVFLAEKLAYSVGRITYSKNKGSKPFAQVLIGAKTKDHILCEKEFRELGCEVKIATDDGSRGFKGYVSTLLKKELSTINYQLSAIYACGPKLLLKEISRISQEYNISAQLSLESHMACGIGACMGCVIKMKPACPGKANRAGEARSQPAPAKRIGPGKPDFEYKRVCKEGPVFEANQILWE